MDKEVVPRRVPLTGAADEGPLVALIPGAHRRLQAHVLVLVVVLGLLALLGRSLHGPSVGPLYAEAPPGAAGVPTPAALRLLQTLTARLQSGAVLGWRERRQHKPTFNTCICIKSIVQPFTGLKGLCRPPFTTLCLTLQKGKID